jgi:hypothetical protein
MLRRPQILGVACGTGGLVTDPVVRDLGAKVREVRGRIRIVS